tara:strand:- start:228 stop:1049 length:822 start_codon:yes stop_codon:yes gene_type:complete
MNTFLCTWNPDKFDWSDLRQKIKEFETVGYVEERWSCGNSKSIRKGDRVFLIRLGEYPKGIMGSGYAKSSVYIAPHWDVNKVGIANYINIEFDILINPENNNLLDKEALETIDKNDTQLWFSQQSGISIKQEVVDALEKSWLEFTIKNKHIKNNFISNDVLNKTEETFIEGRSNKSIRTNFERNPGARTKCLSHHGYSCKVCDFNFERTFGETGKDFIHVHHINPISEMKGEYNLNPISDLVPVCPNCHAMIHQRKPPFTINEIKEMRKSLDQ